MSVLLSTMASPTITLAEEIGDQLKIEEVDKSEEREEKTATSAESKTDQFTENSDEKRLVEEELDQSAKANDSPELPTVSEEVLKQQDDNTTTDKSSDEENETVDMEKIDQLAKRPLTEKYDTTGLSNAEIEKLGLAIFGEVQPDGAKTTMENDLGEKVNIPFKINKFQTFATGTSSSFNMSYTLTGFGVTNSYPIMAHHYMDGKYSYCMDPTYIFYPGSQYTGNAMDISNQTYKNLNDVLNFGAKDGSDEVAAGYTQLLVWARIGWDVTAVGGVGSLSGFKAYQANIEKKMQQWYAKPSFENQTVNLRVGESVTLTDTNNGINEMELTGNTTGTQVTKSGNKITIKATANTNKNGNVIFKKDTPLSDTPLIWVSPGSQSNVTGGRLDPSSILTTVKVNIIKQGDFVLKKVDDTGKAVAGAEFDFIANGKTVSKTTDSNGGLSVTGLDVGTKVEFKETKAPAGYTIDPATSKGSVTIKEGKNEIKVVNPRLGNVTFFKKNDKGLNLEGTTFKLSYLDKVKTLKSDKEGRFEVKGLLPGTKVEWEEISTIAGHYIPENAKGSMIVRSGENTINIENPTLNFGMDSLASNTDGAQFVNPSKGQKLVEQVMIEAHQAPANAKLRLTTDFVEFGTGKLLGKESLKQVTEFEGKQAKFVKSVNLDFDATGMHGKKGVFTNVLEYYNPSTEAWEEVARHDDLNNEAEAIQIVKPEIHTEMFFYDQNSKETKLSDPLAKVKGYDRVFYKNLIAGQTYVFDLSLMSRETGKEFKDPNGKVVKGTLTIVAGKDGKVTSKINAKEYYDNLAKEAADKEDKKDTDATKDSKETDGTKESSESKEADVEKKDAEDADGEKEESEEPTEYTPLVDVELVTGTVDIPFEMNATAAKGKEVVVFEQVSHNDTPVADHKDIKDKKQTGKIHNPKISTKALVNGEKEITEDGKIIFEDIVEYSDLTPGVEYEMDMTVMVKDENAPLELQDKVVKGKATFTPDKESGEVTVKVEFNGKDLFTKHGDSVDLVAFEKLLSNGEEIAKHEDIKDAGQTVKINKPVTPVSAKTGRSLPQTSGTLGNPVVWIAIVALAAAAIFVFMNKKRHDQQG
ncbi:VaFE repeat-containing surface-anchored protein [Enterococcus sp. AZ196]|uniref:VaFE repeat-containing surface-anchored protein n=1 Tax=Enterococcus sp. AZ196 TaxID=2774659 RepID=UPI003D28FA4F